MIVALMPSLPAWQTALVSVPALVAATAAALTRRGVTVAAAWRTARRSSVVMAAVAVAVGLVRITTGGRAGELFRIDTLTVAVLSLIAVVGWVVIRFSAVYLAGDPHERTYVRRLLATLGAVSLVAVANNVVLLVVAWSAASVALHGLLTFFGDRRVAVAVAHKKFLLARSADACMIGAVVAFAAAFDTLRIDAIGTGAMSATSLPGAARVGILLVAIAALLKCAQLPFHGWLIQVMEAPTPVSALLHAGVVNLGGVVLLRFAPVVDRAIETRTLLVVVGVGTAVVASLVMTTRVSVKVALAWSTCAQMGFMLMQCGLGLWDMALVHLLAHSLYKAHAFLGAGGTVRETQRAQLACRPEAPGVATLAIGAVIALAATGMVGAVWQQLSFTKELSVAVWVMLVVVGLAIVPLTTPFREGGHYDLAVRSIGIPIVYLMLHELASRLVPAGAEAPSALIVVAALGFAGLFVVQTRCLVAPTGALAARIRPWIYAGLFLDDAFTRVAFAVFPPPAPTSRPDSLPRPHAVVAVPSRPALSAPVSAAPR